MRKVFISILILVIIIIILYVGFFVFINTQGENLLSERIEAELGVKPEIDSLYLRFPFTLVIEGFSLGDLYVAQAEAAVLGLNPFTPSLSLSRLYLSRLEIKISRKEEGIFIRPFYPQKSLSKNLVEKPQADTQRQSLPEGDLVEENSRRKFAVKVRDFYLSDGKIIYQEESGGETFELAFFNLEASIENFYYPSLPKFFLDFSSMVEAGGKIFQEPLTAKGWVDYSNRNMDVDLKLSHIPYKAFSYYYRPNWQAQNLGVEQAFLSLILTLKAESNDLLVDAILALDKIEFAEIDEDQARLSRQRLAKTFLNLLKDKEGKARRHFKIKTKMDSPQLTPAAIRKSLQESLAVGVDFRIISANIIDRISGLVEEAPEQTLRIPKETLDRTVDTLKDTLDIIKDIFTGQE